MRMSLMVFLGIAAGLIIVCQFKNPANPLPHSIYFSSDVTPMDHDMSSTYAWRVFVNGKNIGAAGTGGSTTPGALDLPKRWYPGLTLNVQWERCEYAKNKCYWTEKRILVQPFSSPKKAWVHLLNDDEILIIPSSLTPGDPDYPGPDFTKKIFFNKQGI